MAACKRCLLPAGTGKPHCGAVGPERVSCPQGLALRRAGVDHR